MEELIDYDAEFKKYFEQWYEKEKNNYQKVEEVEEELPRLYEQWASMQNKRLEQMKAQRLVDLLDAYTRSGMQVPDIVCRALVDRRQETEPLLIKLYRGNMFGEAMQVLLINLLSEMNSAEPVRDFAELIALSSGEGEVVNAASEALMAISCPCTDELLRAYAKAESIGARELLMNAIVSKGRDDRIYALISRLYQDSPNKAFVAAMMGECGDERCLKDLYEAEKSPQINYIDYTEICNAIEFLGGETQRERVFENDPYYEMMSQEQPD